MGFDNSRWTGLDNNQWMVLFANGWLVLAIICTLATNPPFRLGKKPPEVGDTVLNEAVDESLVSRAANPIL